MRQFLLAGSAAYSAAATPDAVAAGAVGFFVQIAGKPTVTATGEEVIGKCDLVLGRTSANGGPVILPIHKNNFSFTKGVYQAATTFLATVTVVAPTQLGDHSIIVVKKGIPFNQKNKYTSSVYVTDITMTATQLAAALVLSINKTSVSSGVTASNAAGVITITTATAGIDYAIVPADKLSSIVPVYTTKGIPAFGDAKYVRDLMNKAAADKGFSYTYSDDRDLLYPSYDTNPLAQPPASDVGYTIFTLRFAEPRDVKTRDEVINQIVQVAFPTGGSGIATFETVVTELAGLTVEV